MKDKRHVLLGYLAEVPTEVFIELCTWLIVAFWFSANEKKLEKVFGRITGNCL